LTNRGTKNLLLFWFSEFFLKGPFSEKIQGTKNWSSEMVPPIFRGTNLSCHPSLVSVSPTKKGGYNTIFCLLHLKFTSKHDLIKSVFSNIFYYLIKHNSKKAGNPDHFTQLSINCSVNFTQLFLICRQKIQQKNREIENNSWLLAIIWWIFYLMVVIIP